MSLISKIKSALKNPKKGLLYLVLGEDEFTSIFSHNTVHSCTLVKNPDSLLETSMTKPSDIHEHLQTLYMLTVELNLRNVLELGTRTGESTTALISAIKKIDGKLTSVDIDSCEEAKKKVRSLNLDKYWNFIQIDDLKLDWDEEIDHLFIDSDHSYEHVLSELQKFEPFVKHGGLITLHDTVTDPRVLKAIKEFISQRVDFRFYHFFNNNGLVILRKN